MKKIVIIGHFGFGKNLLNGQTIKTKIITEEIQRKFGEKNVILLDLAGGIKKIPYLLYKIPEALIKCNNIIIMPVENGLRFLVPILNFWSIFFNRKVHYVVIGGRLPQVILNKTWLKKGLKKFHGIYVETNTMKKSLEKFDLNNLIVLPNCKKLNILPHDKLVYPEGTPFRLCTFSRVMKEKGIGTAVEAVQKINEELGYVAYSLDIYGQIWAESEEWFKTIQQQFPNYISYKGCVAADKSVEVLQDYFALLFPTHFYTEGIPGTIIDAYAAGIPVISAKWESFLDIIVEGKTGLGYEFDNMQELESLLLAIANNPKKILDMKSNCIEKAKEYIPETSIEIIIEKMREV